MTSTNAQPVANHRGSFTRTAPRPWPIPKLPVWALERYRSDRVGILAELGDDGVDIAQARLASLRLVYITEAKLARGVLVDENDAFKKGPAVSRHLVPILGNGLLTCGGEEHRSQRKVLAPKFAPRRIVGFGQTMADIVEARLDEWILRPPTDIDEEFTALTMTIAARTMFGADIGAEEIAVLAQGLVATNRWIMSRATSPVSLPLAFPTPANLKMRRAIKAMDTLVYRLIAEHRARNRQGDVLSALLEARDEDGRGMDDQLVRHQVLTFFLAGHETTAVTLGWAYRQLCEQPELADRIAAEAGKVFGERQDRAAGTTTVSDAGALVYSRAFCQELMRVRPAAYMIGRQALRDVTIGRYEISAGSFVVVNVLGMHRRKDYYPQPHSCRPERFLAEPTWPRAAYLPFGAGPRVCIGNHFALLELTLAVSLICRAFAFGRSTPRGKDGVFEAEPLITLRPSGHIPNMLKRRVA